MTVDDANAILLELMDRHPVGSLQLGGIGMWPLVRLALLYAVLKNAGAPMPAAAEPAAERGCLPEQRAHLGDALLFGEWRRRPDLLLVQSFKDFGSLREGRPTDPLAEGLAELSGEFSVQCLSSIGRASLNSGQAGIAFFQEIDRAQRLKDAEVRAFLALLRPIAADIAARFGRRVVEPLDCLAWGTRILALVPAWSAALQAIEPRAVMVQNYIGLEKLALGAAARRAGIPLIDHQHGMFTRDAAIYLSWPELVPGVIDPMPSWFWVWSDWFCERAPADGTAVRRIVGGDLRHAAAEERAPERASARHTVLYLHQPDLSRAGNGEPLPDDFLQLAAAAPPEWLWLVRLHPRARRIAEAERQCAGLGNVEIAEPTQRPLSHAIALADAALTADSAAAFETVDAGLPTVFTGSAIRARLGDPADPELMIYAGGDAALAALRQAVRKPARPIFLRRDRSLAVSALRTILGASPQQPTSADTLTRTRR